MVRIKDVSNVIESFAPLSLQEDYDNSGLITGNPGDAITGCLICLDVTMEVLEEAERKGMQLLVSHHPVIFGKLTRLTGQTYTERLVLKAIQSGIAIYSVHTNLDNVDRGVSYLLARKLGLVHTKVLQKSKGLLRKLVTFCPAEQADRVRNAIFNAGAGHIGNYDMCSFNTGGTGSFRGSEDANPFVGEPGKLHFEQETRIETVFPYWLEKDIIKAMLDAHPYEEVAYDIYRLENEYDKVGMGIKGELPSEMTEEEFLQFIKDTLKVACIRHSSLIGRKVRKVAVCGGSGSFLIPEAIRQSVDFFVTADVKYHQFQMAGGNLVIADVGHYESEQFTCMIIEEQLKKNFPNFAVQISEIPVNPVNYF